MQNNASYVRTKYVVHDRVEKEYNIKISPPRVTFSFYLTFHLLQRIALFLLRVTFYGGIRNDGYRISKQRSGASIEPYWLNRSIYAFE